MVGRATLLAALVTCVPASIAAQNISITGPEVFLRGTPFTVTVAAIGSVEPVDVVVRLADGTVIADTSIAALGAIEVHGVEVTSGSQSPVEVVVAGRVVAALTGRVLPGFVSILPPLLAIVLALAVREVVTSLFAGIWLGCLFLAGFNPLEAVFMAVNRFGRGELSDPDHAAIVLFTVLLGGMVGIITRMGGMRAIVDAVTPLATNRKRGQIAAWLAGLAVFFDDYANTLVVGNTMRPLTDRLKVSREKLAYIVDSTAAPVAAVFFISTWIGYEVTLIDGGLRLAAQQQSGNAALLAELQSTSPFGVFLGSIPYLFYPLLAIVMVGAVAILGRDFGPMLRAERRAARGDGVHRDGAQLTADMDADLAEATGTPEGRWWNGAIPVTVLVITTLVGLISTGLASLGPDDERTLRTIFGGADPYSPLMWGSILACLTALFLAVGQHILTLQEGILAWVSGLRAMVLAIIILVMAWSLGSVTTALETAPFLARALSDVVVPSILPAAVFVVASVIAFATGTSWATMAILLPLVVPLAVAVAGGLTAASGANEAVAVGSIGSVLAGAIMGDHCSPISDTTVLSSTASSCDHVDHVQTQLPYAVTVALIAVLCGSLPSAMGVPVWLCLVLSVVVVVAVVRFVGKPVEERTPEST